MVKREKKAHHFWNTPRLFLCLLLLIVGIALIFHKSTCSFLIGQESDHYQITRVPRKKIRENESVDVAYDFSSVEPVSIQSVLKAQVNDVNLSVIGGIAVPDVGTNLPIFRGPRDTELSYGAGTMKENRVMDGESNYALASHHVSGLVGFSKVLFSPLGNARVGMKIYSIDKSVVYTYVITEIESVTPDRSDVINDTPGQSQVALATCVGQDAIEHVVVKGNPESFIAYNETLDDILEAFKYSYN